MLEYEYNGYGLFVKITIQSSSNRDVTAETSASLRLASIIHKKYSKSSKKIELHLEPARLLIPS